MVVPMLSAFFPQTHRLTILVGVCKCERARMEVAQVG
jgi:hypothetical protein